MVEAKRRGLSLGAQCHYYSPKPCPNPGATSSRELTVKGGRDFRVMICSSSYSRSYYVIIKQNTLPKVRATIRPRTTAIAAMERATTMCLVRDHSGKERTKYNSPLPSPHFLPHRHPSSSSEQQSTQQLATQKIQSQ